MCIKKKSGPSMGPCGTPHLTDNLADMKSKSTNCIIFVR